jgi:hypothetical protein
MNDGSFRMYYEDQSDPTRLRTTFRSAWSADGLSFTEDPGARLTLLNSGMETRDAAHAMSGRAVMKPTP